MIQEFAGKWKYNRLFFERRQDIVDPGDYDLLEKKE